MAESGSRDTLDKAGSDPYASLIAAIAGGDKAAFRTLYEEAGPRLFGITRRILRRPDLAEDALQEGFLRIWRNAARFDPVKGTGLVWMSTIVRRTALDRVPPNRVEEPIEEEIMDLAGLESADGRYEPRLKPCLGELADSHRDAVVYAFVYGMSHSEIAQRMKAPLGTIKSWVRRGLAQLKDCLGG